MYNLDKSGESIENIIQKETDALIQSQHDCLNV